MSVSEATAADSPFGRHITSAGWFVQSLPDAVALQSPDRGGVIYPIESEDHPFGQIGACLKVLTPGVPSSLYHSEGSQEGFLVLAGRCILIVEEEERELRAYDYFHCPAGVRHVFVGAGEGPCVIFMFGARPDESLCYPVSELAARHGASATVETGDGDEAYADWPSEWPPVRYPWPLPPAQ